MAVSPMLAKLIVRRPSCIYARRGRLIKWKLHSFCIPFVVRRRRRRPSLELSPLGVARPTETTAHKAYRVRIEWYCCYIFSIYDRRKFQGIY